MQLFVGDLVILRRLKESRIGLVESKADQIARAFAHARIVNCLTDHETEAGSHPILLNPHDGSVVASFTDGNRARSPPSVCLDALNHRRAQVGDLRPGTLHGVRYPFSSLGGLIEDNSVWRPGAASPHCMRTLAEVQHPCRCPFGGILNTCPALVTEYQLAMIVPSVSCTPAAVPSIPPICQSSFVLDCIVMPAESLTLSSVPSLVMVVPSASACVCVILNSAV